MNSQFPTIYDELRQMLDIVSAEAIEKGWSDDKKFRITDSGGKSFLLRVSPAEKISSKRACFELAEKADELGIPINSPVLFGSCAEGVYSVFSWIDGADASERIPQMTGEEQYRCGLTAGKALQKLHSVPAPEGSGDPGRLYDKKLTERLDKYAECPFKYDNDAAFLKYIRKNRGLIKKRPQCCQHGDYHIGNMMLDREGKLYIIDLDRAGVGDPWKEFDRIVWCAKVSPLFASGMVNGYFDGNVPALFWKISALYISANIIGSLPWAVPFGQAEINTMKENAELILSWYDGMKRTVPAWYSPPDKFSSLKPEEYAREAGTFPESFLYFRRGLFLNACERYGEAAAEFDSAVSLDRENAASYKHRGYANYMLKLHEKAVCDCSRAIELRPDYAAAYNVRGLAYFELKKYGEAAADYLRSIELCPESFMGYYNSGHLYDRRGELEKAAEAFSKAIEKKPDYAFSYIRRGSVYSRLNKSEETFSDLNKAVKLRPDNAAVYYERAFAHIALLQMDSAVSDLGRFIELQPDNAGAYLKRAQLHNLAERYKQALADCNEAIRLKPDFAEAYLTRAVVYHNTQRYEKAAADNTRAIGLDPKNDKAYFNRAANRRYIAPFEAVIEDYGKVIELSGDRGTLISAYTERAKMYRAVNKPQLAAADEKAAEALKSGK